MGLMLVLSSVPVLGLSIILGGLSPGEIAASLCVLCSAVAAAGALGLFLSSVAPRTVTATVIAYLVVGIGMVGLPLIAAVLETAGALQRSGSEWAILATLLALVMLALPPAVALAAGLYAFRRRSTPVPPSRTWWILTTGFSWAALLLLLYLPAGAQLLLDGYVLLTLHPALVILDLMESPLVSRRLLTDLWALGSLAYASAAVCLFALATAQVHRMRAS
jgi:hypothetical protein